MAFLIPASAGWTVKGDGRCGSWEQNEILSAGTTGGEWRFRSES